MSILQKCFYFIILLAFFSGCSKPPPNVVISAKLSFISGEAVTVSHNGQTSKAKINMRLNENDIIETGANSEVRILFANIGISTVRENTKVQINKLIKTVNGEYIKMNLSKGKILSSLRKLTRDEDRFEIETPTAVAGVRGTTFLVAVSPNKDTRTAVFSGKVEVRKIDESGKNKVSEEVIIVEELKEAFIPADDFNKNIISTMSEKTYKEIEGVKEMKELEELNLQEIKEEITQTEMKWEVVKKEIKKENAAKPKKSKIIQW